MANNDTIEEELPVLFPVHAHSIQSGLVSQYAELLTNPVLLKDGGNIFHVDAGQHHLTTQLVHYRLLRPWLVTNINIHSLGRGREREREIERERENENYKIFYASMSKGTQSLQF